MLTKQEFVKIIKDIQENDKEHNELTKVLSKFCDGAGFLFLGDSKIYYNLLMLLKKEMNDSDNFIEWWLYEDVEKIVRIRDKVYTIDTVEQLYDFLINYNN